MSRHIVLAGDSIFDNAVYVPGEPCVTEQLQAIVSDGDRVTMLAVDGDCAGDVLMQLQSLPTDATHILVSAGGNDALLQAGELYREHASSLAMFSHWSDIQAGFRRTYREMLAGVANVNCSVGVCTIYDAVPSVTDIERTALSLFNDVIVREATALELPVVDLRHICVEASDYSELSPIEPSSQGGEKIAAALYRMLVTHDFDSGETVIYKGVE